MNKLLIVLFIASTAFAIAFWANRKRNASPVHPRREHTVPAQLDRLDFTKPSARWLIVVFSSSTCQACAEVLATAASFAGPDVAVQDVEFARDRHLHDRYGIDTVPTTVLVDLDGAVRAHWLGHVDSAELLTRLADPETA
ncbi:MAG: hypothetical protein IH940_03675 [Acidobacteria bacterium]|nr:hypothetical protein [Acidobacteriota bacterium]